MMAKHTVTIALGATVAATAGCMTAAPVLLASSKAPDHIDLSMGQAAPDGYSKVTLKVTGLPDFRRLQSFNTSGASLSIVVTKPSHDKVVDANGKDAIYDAKVTSGAATITLPALPNTKAAPTTSSPFFDSTTAYIFTTFLFKADPSVPPTAPSLANDVARFGTAVGSGFRFDKLFKDIDDKEAGTLATINLLGSGATRADVVPGLPVNVTVSNTAHVNGNFTVALLKHIENTLIVAPSGANSAGVVSEQGVPTLRLRMPGVDRLKVKENGSPRTLRFAMAFPSGHQETVRLTVTRFSPATGLLDSTLLDNTALGTTLHTSKNNTTISANDRRTHYTDLDVASLPDGRNVVDLKFTGFSTYSSLTILPLFYSGILSNGNGNSDMN